MKCPICGGMGTSNTCVNGTFKPCAFCNGTGEVEVVGDSVTDVYDKCGGTGFFCEMRTGDFCTLGSPCPHQKPLTNEEWLKQCTTEQLAEWINNIVDDGIIKAWMIKNNCCGDYLESVKWWLKQPHREIGK